MIGSDLQRFIYRVEVLKLYRNFMRVSRRAPLDARAYLRQEVYREFWKQKDAQDVHAIKYFLSDGKSRLKQLEEMLGMQS